MEIFFPWGQKAKIKLLWCIFLILFISQSQHVNTLTGSEARTLEIIYLIIAPGDFLGQWINEQLYCVT